MQNGTQQSDTAGGQNNLSNLLLSGSFKGGTHLGGSLERMVEAYKFAPAVASELVQNSIDTEFGGASHIQIHVDYDKNKIEYYDNGKGLSPETLAAALNTIGKSVKKSDRYGKFGIGMASPISICSQFKMTTAPSGQSYLSVTFNRLKLFNTAEGKFDFPVALVNTISHNDTKTPHHNRWSDVVWWRTAIEMEGLTLDKVKRKFDAEEFKADIQARYSEKLAKLGTSIKVMVTYEGETKEISFKAKLYAGKALPVWERNENGAGKVSVTFYITPHGYKGAVNVNFRGGDNPSKVPLKMLHLTPFMVNLDPKVKEAIKSGMFQGEVTVEHLKMKVDRNSFEHDDAQTGLKVALEAWYQEIGSKHYENTKARRAATRYQEIGLKVIEKYGDLLSGKEGSLFADVFAKATFGSIGRKHNPVPGKTVLPGAMMTAIAVVGEKKSFPGNVKGGTHTASTNEGHRPAVAVGPLGQTRQVTKGHSTGFHIMTDDLGSKLWHFDPASLCLKINPSHEHFVRVEKSDAKLNDLFSNIMITSFRVASQPLDFQQAAQLFAEEHMGDWVDNLLVK